MDVLGMLQTRGSVFLGHHFVYTSGKHGSAYIDLDPILPDTDLMTQLCTDLVMPYVGQVDVVAAPATGAIVLAVLAARALAGDGEKVAAVWADKEGGDFAFARAGFAERLDGRRVLLVEDLVTTGGSVAKVLRQALRHGAVIVGASAICNRGAITAAQLGLPRLTALADVEMQATDADRCELCAAAVPIVEDVGHGRMVKARQPDYPGGFVRLAKP